MRTFQVNFIGLQVLRRFRRVRHSWSGWSTASSDVSFLGSPAGVVVRMRLQVVAMEHFGARVGQLTTRGPPFAGRLDVDGLVWDRSATKVARSTSLADERALLRQIDAYVGSGGSEWAGSDTDSDDDFCSPSEGGSGDDYVAGDYL